LFTVWGLNAHFCPAQAHASKSREEKMSSRTPVIAGNWKMHKTNSEARQYVSDLADLVADISGVEIVLSPPFTSLAEVAGMTRGTNMRVAAQNMHFEASGAFTGEVSAEMLVDLGIDDVILGHSERRQYFCENDADLAKKVTAALEAGIRPILCVGESDEERESGKTEEKIRHQVSSDLSDLTAGQLPGIVIAYEPIWAIGTGKTATPAVAQEACGLIRSTLAELFSDDGASQVRILYGGSVKPGNISELMAEEDIDGALVGGACLSAADFSEIVGYRQG